MPGKTTFPIILWCWFVFGIPLKLLGSRKSGLFYSSLERTSICKPKESGVYWGYGPCIRQSFQLSFVLLIQNHKMSQVVQTPWWAYRHFSSLIQHEMVFAFWFLCSMKLHFHFEPCVVGLSYSSILCSITCGFSFRRICLIWQQAVVFVIQYLICLCSCIAYFFTPRTVWHILSQVSVEMTLLFIL